MAIIHWKYSLLFLAILLSPLVGGCGRDRELPPVADLRAREVTDLVKKGKGAVTVVNVWASWCDPCKEEMPDLLRMKKAYDAKGVKVLFLSADDREDVDSLVRPLLASLDIDFVTYVGGDSTDDQFIAGMSPEWNGALPATFLYDATGVMREMLVGKQSYEVLRDAVEHLLPQVDR